MRPAVSVVVPTYRRPALLGRCLAALLAQRSTLSEPFEIIVVDDGHDDATHALVDHLRRALQGEPGAPALRYRRPLRGRGPAVARNVGWRSAEASLVAFTDDDTVADLYWLREGLAALRRNPHWAGAGGRVLVPPPAGRHTRPTDHELMTRGLEDTEFVTANAFVRRSALERVGGFDERFTRAWREDSDLQFSLLEKVGAVGRAECAVVLHPVRAERWGLSLRQQPNALFEALLYKKHPALYRERVEPKSVWRFHGTVAASLLAAAALARRRPRIAAAASAVAAALVGEFAARRLARTSREPAHVAEVLATSPLIPFLSVYWRLRGAWRFSVPFA